MHCTSAVILLGFVPRSIDSFRLRCFHIQLKLIATSFGRQTHCRWGKWLWSHLPPGHSRWRAGGMEGEGGCTAQPHRPRHGGSPGGRRALGWSHHSLECPCASCQALPAQAFRQGCAPHSLRGCAQSPWPAPRSPRTLCELRTGCTPAAGHQQDNAVHARLLHLGGDGHSVPCSCSSPLFPRGQGMPKAPQKYCRSEAKPLHLLRRLLCFQMATAAPETQACVRTVQNAVREVTSPGDVGKTRAEQPGNAGGPDVSPGPVGTERVT